MDTYLAQVNMPSRGEVVSLATRLTNIELRLDDMQAQLDDVLTAIRAVAAAAPAATADDGEAKSTTPRRTRKATNE
jgi:ribosomal protein L12E/L44/L45/RPP1/RPP2